MNIPESNHIPTDLGSPLTWTQNRRPAALNPLKRLSPQVIASENFGLKVEYLRQEAIAALGKIGPPARAAIPALVALQNEALVGTHAKDALSKIRGN
jgi:hypothetical protein